MYYPTASTRRYLPTRTEYIIPAFEESVEWEDVSEVLLRYPIENTVPFSVKLPVRPPNDSFLLAVAWEESGQAYRYKFWEGGSLHYPIYNGERIGAGAYFEIWSAGDFAAESDDITLESSFLNETEDINGLLPTTPSVTSVTLTPE